MQLGLDGERRVRGKDVCMTEARSAPHQDRSSAASETLTVVVADDSDSYRATVVRALGQGAGMEVVREARNGNEAICAVRELLPDILVVDDQMPVAGGRVVAREVADDPSLQSVRVIMLSARERTEPVATGAGAGMFVRIAKTASETEIGTAVRCVGRRPARGTA
jgi:DNA-binding NarL/FixJ family response regulator